MISLESVEQSIIELESKDTTFTTCERLAWLYVVRDHLKGYTAPEPKTFKSSGQSDFLQTANGKNSDAVWAIMDELMSTLALTNPRVYESVLRKLRAL